MHLLFTMCIKQFYLLRLLAETWRAVLFVFVFIFRIPLPNCSMQRQQNRNIMCVTWWFFFYSFNLCTTCLVSVCACVSVYACVCVCHELPIKDAFHSIKTTKNRLKPFTSFIHYSSTIAFVYFYERVDWFDFSFSMCSMDCV